MPCFSPIAASQLASGRVVFHENVGTDGKQTKRRNNKHRRAGRADLLDRGVVRSLRLRCGRCPGCRKDRNRQWAARILHEKQSHTAPSWFVTLTDDDQHTPPDGALDYGHFQLFVRRLRRALSPKYPRRFIGPRRPPVSIRFFVAGEYGGQTSRPHFHAVLFGLDIRDLAYLRKSPAGFTLWTSPTLEKAWGRGFISIGALTFESAAYVAGYVLKKLDGDPDQYKRVNKQTGEIYSVPPEFGRMSLRPAIGKRWFERYHSDCLPRDYVVADGRKMPVPRYYSQLFKKLNPDASEGVEYERLQRAALQAGDCTPERLATREKVALAALSLKSRKL